MKLAVAIALVMAGALLASGLDAVKAERNPERRSKLALDNANSAIDAARDAYSAGHLKQSNAALAEVRESVELCLESLDATGKNARKSPKPFKHAELEIRGLVRRLKSLETDFSVEDRGEVLSTEQRLQEVHDELISRIMSKRK